MRRDLRSHEQKFRHLDSRHRDTPRQIFQHPTSHNIEWRAVKNLLKATGAAEPVHHPGHRGVPVGLDEPSVLAGQRCRQPVALLALPSVQALGTQPAVVDPVLGPPRTPAMWRP